MTRPVEEQCRYWMAKSQMGDKLAYAQLLAHVQSMAQRYVISRLSNHADAHDVVQEMLLSVHKARATYDVNKPFYPWMYAIINYRLHDYFRRHYRKRDREAPELDSDKVDDSATNPEQWANDKQLTTKLLLSLNAKQRQIVEMLYVQGNSAQEVSKALNLSISDVRVTAHRALKELKQKAEKVA